MTQAPTPGPLTSESVKLLVKGDLLLCADRIIRSVEQVDVERGVLWFTDGEACGPSVCVFIGRPDADGWMPWSGSQNPCGSAVITARLVTGAEITKRADHFPAVAWSNLITKIRLSPTAPVEASGQDDHDLKLIIAHTIIEDLRVQHPGIEQIDNERGDIWLPGGSTPQSSGCIIDIHSVAQSVEQQVLAALRPGHTDLMVSPENIDAFLEANPPPVEASGSEREHGPKCWGKTSISDEMMYCYCGSTDSPSGETREALGGQKGDSETLRVLLDNLVIAQTLSKDIRQKATDEARSYLYDLRHTPQPSGEAREAVARLVDPKAWGLFDRGWFPDLMPSRKTADAILALLSARPFALGGQHSGAEASIGRNITFSPFDLDSGNAVVSPEEPDGPYWTLIAQGGEAEQNAIAAEIVRRLNTTPARAETLSGAPYAGIVEEDRRSWPPEPWGGFPNSEYDAEDCASLADDILHAFNGSPVLSSSALGYVSADAEAALKAGINRVIYPAPSAHASFPLYAAPVPAQDDDKLRIAVEEALADKARAEAQDPYAEGQAASEKTRADEEDCPYAGGTDQRREWLNGFRGEGKPKAQDEGAAGEASAYRVRMISNDPVEWVLMHPEKALDFLSRKGWESQPLYAHPSPTLAADADRVRIAVEALEYYAGPHAMPNDGPWGASSDDYGRRASEAIAALKLGRGK